MSKLTRLYNKLLKKKYFERKAMKNILTWINGSLVLLYVMVYVFI